MRIDVAVKVRTDAVQGNRVSVSLKEGSGIEVIKVVFRNVSLIGNIYIHNVFINRTGTAQD